MMYADLDVWNAEVVATSADFKSMKALVDRNTLNVCLSQNEATPE